MTSTALATTNGAGSGVAVYNEQFSREQLDLLKRTVAEGTSDDEFALFCEVCKTTGLNPFQRQIYAIMRTSKTKVNGKWVEQPKMTIQTGIDGYRLTASRTGQHAGTSDVEYGPANAQGYPAWARVTVKRVLPGGAIAEFSATARWEEYCQTKEEWSDGERTGRAIPSGQWGKMPFLMLGKCAEALALRKAFPAELSGVYTSEEMGQADNAAPAPVSAAPPTRQTTTQVRQASAGKPQPNLLEQDVDADTFANRGARLKAAIEANGLDKAELGDLCERHFGHRSFKRMPDADLEKLITEHIPAAGQDKAAAAAQRDGIETAAERVEG